MDEIKIGSKVPKENKIYTNGSVAEGYAKSLGQTIAMDQLSKPWFYSFLKRDEELKVVSPQKLTSSRAKSYKLTMVMYFSELHSVLQQNDL